MENLKLKAPNLKSIHAHRIPPVLSIISVSLLFLSVVVTGSGPSQFLFDLNPMRSAANSSILSASPNPIHVCDGSGVGSTTLSWAISSTTRYEVRKGSQTGQLISSGQGSGSQTVSGISSASTYILYQLTDTTTYQWRYVNGRWVRVPVTVTKRTELARVSVSLTSASCGPVLPVSVSILPIVNATASSTYADFSPLRAYDGNTETFWSSGGFPAKQFFIDLGEARKVTGIRLLTAQSPAGNVTHEIFAGSSAWPAQAKVYTFSQYATDQQWLETTFPVPFENIRFITISTTASPSWVAWREVEVVGQMPAVSQVPYYGYYANAMEQVGSGNYISEIGPHANLAWVRGDWSSKLQQARSLGMKAVVDVFPYFFDTNTYVLRPDYVQQWSTISQAIAPYINDVAAFYVLDEPYHSGRAKGLSDDYVRTSVEASIDLIRQAYPNIPHAVFFAYTETDNSLVIPRGYDWVGVDCYGPFDNCYGKSLPQYYSILKSKMNANQKLMIIPQSYWPATSGVGETEQSEILSRADDYYSFIASEPRTVAVIPFLWQSFEGGAGARDLPRVKNWFVQMGENITR